jgi:hypothetical protein
LADEINLDTSTAIAFVSEGSHVRQALKTVVRGMVMVMTETALSEFQRNVAGSAGPLEQARAARFLARVTVIPDDPSPRARALRPTRSLEPPDILILGTGDARALVTMTADRRSVRAARFQGVDFQVYLHEPVPLTGA